MNTDALSGHGHMFELIASLPEQLRLGTKLLGVHDAATSAVGTEEILVCGMGGSAIAADLIVPLLGTGRLTPHREYGLPRWIPTDTLVVLSSYSGDTEEVLSAAQEVRRRGLKHVVLSSGGSLPALCSDVPWIVIPGGLPPRASLGYGLGAMLRLCGELGLLRPDLAEVEAAADDLEQRNDELGPEAGEDSQALTLARALVERTTHIHTTSPENHAVGRRWRAQIQENAKQPAACSEYPELNHNEIEGAVAPGADRPALVLLRGGEEHSRIKTRIEATEVLLGEQFASTNHVAAVGDDPLTRILCQVQLGDFVSCHMAALKGIDPVPVPTIIKLKSRLQEGDTP